MIIFYLILIFYSGLGGWGKPHHYLLIYPLPQIILANYLIALKKSKKTIALFSVVFIALFFSSYIQFQYASAKTCGRKNWSCSTEKVVDFVSSPDQTLVAADWGLATQLFFYTQGKNPINELVFLANTDRDNELSDEIAQLAEKCALFVIPSKEEGHFDFARDKIESRVRKLPDYYERNIYGPEDDVRLHIFQCQLTQDTLLRK